MEDSCVSRRRKQIHLNELKLVCSFNGTFQHRPPSGKLRYTGGETRIVSVDRNIAFSKLRSKISQLISPNDSISFSLKYQLPVSDSADEEIAVVLITSDDDVRCMIDEYEKLELSGKRSRLWIYVYNQIPISTAETENLNGRAVLCTIPKFNEQGDLCFNGFENGDKFMNSVKQQLLDNQPLIDFTSESESPVTHESTLQFDGVVHSNSMLNYGIESCLGNLAGPSIGNYSQPVVGAQSQKKSCNPDVNLMPTGADNALNMDNTVSSCNQVFGNVVPVKSLYSCDRVWGGFYGGMRNLRSSPYYVRNYKSNFMGIGNYCGNLKLDGRQRVGKIYPCHRSSLNISKQGQAMKLSQPGLWKPCSGHHYHTPEKMRRMVDSGNSMEQPLVSKENFEDTGDPGAPHNGMHSSKNGVCIDKDDETDFGCNSSLAELSAGSQSVGKHHSGTHPIQGGIASLLDLDMCNISFLSSKEESESESECSPVSKDISEVLPKPQLKQSDLMDEECLCSGLVVDIPSGGASNSPAQNAAKLEMDDNEKEEIQQDPLSTLSFDDKEVYNKEFSSNMDAQIPSDLAGFYAHLATRELQIIKNSDIECIKELGSGTYGTVFFGKWKGSDVAIKKLKSSCFAEGTVDKNKLIQDFWKEAQLLGQLHHPNIVALYGVVADGPVTNLATVTEYMVNGSLKQVLRRKDRTIDRRKRLIIAMDAAFGMEYLHAKNIVHFDLKSHNFLVNMKDPQRPVCKIGDLGLSKIKERTYVSAGVRGTIPWMAPELLSCKKNMVTEKVDVYSFGIVMCELLTGEEPYSNMRSQEIIAGIIKGDLRPEIPSWCDPAWRSLMERCWSSDPDSRPSFSEIAKELRTMAAAMNIK